MVLPKTTPTDYNQGFIDEKQDFFIFKIDWLLAATFASHLAFGYFIVLSLLLLPLTFLSWERLPWL